MKLYLSFLIKVLDTLELDFPEELNNPVLLARKFLNDEASESDYEKGAELCWAYIDDRDAIRNFSDRDILLARIGTSVLSANKDLDQAGKKLAWFFEVLDFLKVNIDAPLEMMRNHFDFED
ncbi:hypothetical protein C7H09_12425 [Marinobacter fuscus]|uniref:Uncharacterized protein n=1 Tax=Marinobacter fuscus TaxID=2109942 RepID=A0A2T1K6Y3_9GAMM|nr:hypothetical protein [Marinobacter fuscus]PSF05911.1 hypothetical protein C7H09_12425 [Marinobacter fuscus]